MTVPTWAPPAVLPVNDTSPVAKPVTASLKMTVKLIGLRVGRVGLAAAWLMVTVGRA